MMTMLKNDIQLGRENCRDIPDTSEHLRQALPVLNDGSNIRDTDMLLSFYSNFSNCFKHLEPISRFLVLDN